MNRSPLLLLLLIFAGACAPAVPVAIPPAGAGSAEAYPTTPPQPGPAPVFSMETPVERTLSNGLRVIYVPRHQLPLIDAVLVTRGGVMDDPAQQTGLASFTAAMLDEGADGLSALELAEAVEQLGATLRTGAGWDAAQVSLRVLREELPRALELMADVTFRPDFPEAEIERLRDERLTALARARDDAAVIAGNAFSELVFGPEHPYGRLTTQESIRRIDRAALRQFHSRFYRPADAALVLVGDIGPEDHALIEEIFGAWENAPVPAAVIPAVAELPATQIVLLDKPGAPQSEIRIGHPGVARDNPDFYALQVLNTLLGGSFTSRLNQNLRETHGYTYGASSGFGMRLGRGPFIAAAAVVTEKTDSAVIEFFRELNRIREEPIPQDELERTKQYVALRLPQQLETTGQIAGRVAELATYDLPLDYYDSYVQRIMAVTAADVERVAREYLHPARAVVVIVGDRQTVEPGLRALAGIGPVDIREVEEFVP